MSLEDYIKNDSMTSLNDLIELEKYYEGLIKKYNTMGLTVSSDILKKISIIKDEIYRRE